MDVLVFGLQSEGGIVPHLRTLLFNRVKPLVVSSFLSSVSSMLRSAIAQLPASQREKFPPFANLEEFVESYASKHSTSHVVESTLLCVAQIADYLSLLENYQPATPTAKVFVGQSGGLVSAGAASVLPRGSLGVPLAVHAVEVAFRLALHVDSVAEHLHPAANKAESWTVCVKDLDKTTVESLIDDFITSTSLPEHNRPYISSTFPSAVWVTASPPILHQLLHHSSVLQTAKTSSIPNWGPYHASHLLDVSSLPKILKLDRLHELEALLDGQAPSGPVLSPRDGLPYKADSLADLYTQILTDVLTHEQDFVSLGDHYRDHILPEQVECHVIPVGPFHDAMLVDVLQQETPGQPFMFDWKQSIPESPKSQRSAAKEKIAIVGVAGRFPGAQDLEQFWGVLLNGLDMHREVPTDRFDSQKHFDPTGKGRNKSHTPFGCFVDHAGLFDPRFFNMSPREATQTDPMQRLALTTAYEALEMAGFTPNRTPSSRLDRIGTFYGQTSDDWREINEAQDIDTYFITGGVRAFGPGRINYHFGFSGPSFNVDTACSSSMAAIHVACNSLWLGDCDTAITGGVNIMTNPDIFSGLSKGQFLSKTGPCQTFDNDADGYCRGDGVATLILKRLSDAEADNDNILGLILSVATNHSADAISITHPHDKTQEILYRRVLNQADVDPSEVCYVEMHGTGTQAGDDTEMRSVTNVFAPAGPRRNEKVYLGSVKANVGHGEAVSGVTALTKALLMLEHNTIPPHVGIKKEMNKGFPDLAARNAHIAFKPTLLPRPASGTRKIFVNNFSAAGGNTAVVLEEGPVRRLKGADPRKMHVVSVSARALSAMKDNLHALVDYIDSNPGVSLPSLSYTTTARRMHHHYRFAVTASDISAVRKALSQAIEREIVPVPRPPRIAFSFTGQGSLCPGVGQDLFNTCTSYRESLLEFDSIATSFGFPSFLSLVDGTINDPTFNLNSLSPVLVQVCQVAIEMALTGLWQSLGITPEVVIGHSLGEYGALYAAGVLSASDTIYLVGCRAQLLEEMCTAQSHAMLAIKSPLSTILDLISSDNPLEVACINSGNEVVLSGESQAIDTFRSVLEKRGIPATRLNVPYAFHSSQIDAILDSFEKVASSITFAEPKCKILSPLTGKALAANEINAVYLCRHARETVNFFSALTAASSAQIIDSGTIFVEIGPHPISTSFVKSSLGTSMKTCYSLHRKEGAWDSLCAAATMLHNNGAQIRWAEYHRDFEGSLELLRLPTYRWALANYWIDYKNDWCLTKGDPVVSSGAPEHPVPSAPKTTSVQQVVKEEFSDSCNMLIAETDIARPDLRTVLFGHMVNGVALCPSSLYGDIGITIGEYMYRRMNLGSPDIDLVRANVRDMEVPKTLIARPDNDSPHMIKIVAEASPAKDVISFTISSQQGDHAHFKVDFGTSASWLQEWKRNSYLVESRMQSLCDASESHVLRQTMAYKLFGSFVEYDTTFQGIKKVFLDPTHWEATAEIVLETPKADQDFVVPPYWIDSIGHLSGFIMNVHQTVDTQNTVFVSHGWESLRLARTMMPGTKYRTYVRMTEIEGTNMVAGDVCCFQDSAIIALFQGVKFMNIPRRVLDQVLPHPKSAVARQVAQPKPQPVVAETINRAPETSNAALHKALSTVSLMSRVLSIVAEECGVDNSELADPNNFADLGVDSLMQLAICSRIREELEMEVPSSLFLDYPTVGELKAYLRTLDPVLDEMDTSSPGTPSSNDSDFTSHGDDSEGTSLVEITIPLKELKEKPIVMNPSAPVVNPISLPPLTSHKATSFLLQGNPKTAKTTFFLFPDGGGSATSYARIPDLSPDVVVYGLNSPFMTIPHEYTCGVSGVARYYVNEMRRRQPHGPYNVGGWSAGGVVAFEGAQQLIRDGEQVDRLILIDSPCPLTIEPLPISLHRWFNSLGLLGDGDPNKIPSWLLPHFQASINALSTYNARAIESSKAPTTYVIWCEDGVCKYPTDPRPEPYPYGHAQFLLENKVDFGPQLWDAMLGRENLVLSHVPGNHFTMMTHPFVNGLGEEMRRAFL